MAKYVDTWTNDAFGSIMGAYKKLVDDETITLKLIEYSRPKDIFRVKYSSNLPLDMENISIKSLIDENEHLKDRVYTFERVEIPGG